VRGAYRTAAGGASWEASLTPQRHFTAFRLERVGGCSVRVPRSGLLLGRSPEADVILADPAASQRQAILLGSGAGLQLFPLGRNPTFHNGRPAAAGVVLGDGDAIEVPGGRFVLRVGQGAATELSSARWLAFSTGERYGVQTPTFSAGGGADDDVRVPGWPPDALRFLVAQGALAVVLAHPCEVNGEPREAGEVLPTAPGDAFVLSGREVRLLADDGEPGGPTVAGNVSEMGATAARLEFMPNGGRLELHFEEGSGPRVVELPELRARLIAVLLASGGGFAPGDDVPDEVVLAGVWPRTNARDRGDLNQLVHRTRRDLLGAGINPERVLYRPRRGGSLRLLLAPGAVVRVA
jgi:hypothetical protein